MSDVVRCGILSYINTTHLLLQGLKRIMTPDGVVCLRLPHNHSEISNPIERAFLKEGFHLIRSSYTQIDIAARKTNGYVEMREEQTTFSYTMFSNSFFLSSPRIHYFPSPTMTQWLCFTVGNVNTVTYHALKATLAFHMAVYPSPVLTFRSKGTGSTPKVKDKSGQVYRVQQDDILTAARLITLYVLVTLTSLLDTVRFVHSFHFFYRPGILIQGTRFWICFQEQVHTRSLLMLWDAGV